MPEKKEITKLFHNKCISIKNPDGSCWLNTAIHIIFLIKESYTTNFGKIFKKYNLEESAYISQQLPFLLEMNNEFCPKRPKDKIVGGQIDHFLPECFKHINEIYKNLIEVTGYSRYSMQGNLFNEIIKDTPTYTSKYIFNYFFYRDENILYKNVPLKNDKTRSMHETILLNDYTIISVTINFTGHVALIKYCDNSYYLMDSIFKINFGKNIDKLFETEDFLQILKTLPKNPENEHYDRAIVFYSKLSKTSIESVLYHKKNTDHIIATNTYDLSNKGIKNLGAISIKSDVDTLVINNNAISSFEKLENTNIVQIIAKNNKFTKLDGSVLPKTLRRIDVSNNDIQIITKSSIPPNVAYINLGNNQITELKNLTFPETLVDLSFNYNQITTIESVNFGKELNNLVLSNNSLTNIDTVNFPKKLQMLAITDNELTSMMFLNRIFSLKKIILSRNKISVPQGAVVMVFAEYINLGHNQIEAINSCSFSAKAKVLLLNNNKIKSIIYYTFPENLEKLDLSNNLLRSIDNAVFGQKLVKLNLSHNKINYINKLFLPDALEELYIDHNEITSVENVYINKNLKIFSMEHNKINKVEYIHGCDANLDIFSFAYNEIEFIKNAIINFAKNIKISNNKLYGFINSEFGNYRDNVNVIDFSYNLIEEINLLSIYAHNVEVFNLSNNKIKNPYNRSYTKEREREILLKLQYSDILTFSGSIHSIKTINLSYNPITDIKAILEKYGIDEINLTGIMEIDFGSIRTEKKIIVSKKAILKNNPKSNQIIYSSDS